MLVFFAQYGEIKANTVDVYFGLIFGYFSASRTKREKRAKLSEPRRVQLNPPRKKFKKRLHHIRINNKCVFWNAPIWSDEHTENWTWH